MQIERHLKFFVLTKGLRVMKFTAEFGVFAHIYQVLVLGLKKAYIDVSTRMILIERRLLIDTLERRPLIVYRMTLVVIDIYPLNRIYYKHKIISRLIFDCSVI